MSAPTYRAGIAGLGFIGAGDQVSGDALGQQVTALDGTHAAALSNSSRITLVAGSSRDAGRRERFQQRHAVNVYADWREMIARENLAIVSVATYTPQHAEITIAAAQAGARVVYCEKPIASSVADAEQMLAACDQSGTLLVINHNRRFNPNYHRLRDLIASGGLGDLTSAALRWGTGRLGNVGTHSIDALCMLTSRRIEAVSGSLDLSAKADCRGAAFHDPGGWGVLRLEGPLMTTLDAANHANRGMEISIFGTKGSATAGGDEVVLRWADGRTETWPSPRAEATSMDRAVAEIVDWLDGKLPSYSYDPADALHVLESIVAFHVSHDRRAAWVDLPLTSPDRERVIKSG